LPPPQFPPRRQAPPRPNGVTEPASGQLDQQFERGHGLPRQSQQCSVIGTYRAIGHAALARDRMSIRQGRKPATIYQIIAVNAGGPMPPRQTPSRNHRSLLPNGLCQATRPISTTVALSWTNNSQRAVGLYIQSGNGWLGFQHDKGPSTPSTQRSPIINDSAYTDLLLPRICDDAGWSKRPKLRQATRLAARRMWVPLRLLKPSSLT